MRKNFPEYFPLEKVLLKSLWNTADISIDANVILNLYRYTPSTQQEIIRVLEYLAKVQRLWISHQASHEFLKNRNSVIDSLEKSYSHLQDDLQKKLNETENVINQYKRHPYLEVSGLNKIYKECFDNVSNSIADLFKAHPDYSKKDPILEKVANIFDGCIGDYFDEVTLDKLFTEGKKRYDKKIPPGYMDTEKQKAGDQSLYGDLIIWKQLLKYAKDNKVDIIWVTDDLKEDWWLRFNGKTISPRPELIREFYKETEQNIIIYNPQQFLQHAITNLRINVTEKAVKEVEHLRKLDWTDFRKQNDEELYVKNKLTHAEDNVDKDFIINNSRVYSLSDYHTTILKKIKDLLATRTPNTEISNENDLNDAPKDE